MAKSCVWNYDIFLSLSSKCQRKFIFNSDDGFYTGFLKICHSMSFWISQILSNASSSYIASDGIWHFLPDAFRQNLARAFYHCYCYYCCRHYFLCQHHYHYPSCRHHHPHSWGLQAPRAPTSLLFWPSRS
jgi:hypothetical protein